MGAARPSYLATTSPPAFTTQPPQNALWDRPNAYNGLSIQVALGTGQSPSDGKYLSDTWYAANHPSDGQALGSNCD